MNAVIENLSKSRAADSSLSVLSFFVFMMIAGLFLVGTARNVPWQPAWIIFGTSNILVILSYAYRLVKFEAACLDAFLIPFFLFVLTVAQPFLFAFRNGGFPYVWGTEIHDNSVANGTGAILSLFLAFYFLGRIRFSRVRRAKYKHYNRSVPVKGRTISSGFLFAFSILSFYPFFAYGSGGVIENFLINVSGRQTGYVAFSDSAIGNSDPLSILIAQLIPVVMVLNFIFFLQKRRLLAKLFHFLLACVLFALLISLGGRTWVVLSILTILVWLYFSSNNFSERFYFYIRSIIMFALLIGAMQWQIQSRNQGVGSASSSALVGFDINKEVALVYNSLPVDGEYLIASNTLESIILPLPTYAYFVVTSPIPRIIWENKPIDPSFVYINELRTGHSGLGTGSNVTVSIPGRAYANFGFSGVIQHAFVLGLILSSISRRIVSTYKDDHLRILYIFVVCLVAVNVRELQAGKLYPILWLLFMFWSQRFWSSLTLRQRLRQ